MRRPAITWFIHLLKLVLAVAILVWLMRQVSLVALTNTLAQSDWRLVGLALLLVLLGVVLLQAYETHKSIEVAQRPGILPLVRINLIMMFYAFFLPAALVLAIRWAKYRCLGLEGWHSLALVGIHKLLQLLVVVSTFCITFVTIDASPPKALVATNHMLLAGLALLAGYFTVLALGQNLPSTWRCSWHKHGHRQLCRGEVKCKEKRFSSSAESLAERITHRLLATGTRLTGAMLTFRNMPWREKLWCLMLALLQHGCVIFSAYLVMLSLAPNTPLLPVILVRSLLIVLLMMPIAIAGIGVRELVFFTLFPFYGVEADVALAGSLLLLGIQLCIALLGALLELYDKLYAAPVALHRLRSGNRCDATSNAPSSPRKSVTHAREDTPS